MSPPSSKMVEFTVVDCTANTSSASCLYKNTTITVHTAETGKCVSRLSVVLGNNAVEDVHPR
ncbi:unnamed protein product [Lupinus luteus]|uniref:Uncharacterized protein n=1 Tax=Lupinus luteus TaxID=3873 RepID=A0AAV1WA77_LUPLU